MSLSQCRAMQLTKPAHASDNDVDGGLPEAQLLTKSQPVRDEAMLKDPAIELIDTGTEANDVPTGT